MASEEEQKHMISAFLDVAEGQTSETALRFLQAAAWDLENALYLNFTATPDQVATGESEEDSKSSRSSSTSSMSQEEDGDDYAGTDSDYPDEADWGYLEEIPTATRTGQNTHKSFSIPDGLMFSGPFENAKKSARSGDKWLLVNLQHIGNFSSLELDRDTWNDPTVVQVIKSNFIFWQDNVKDYYDTSEGAKVCRFYKQQQESLPVIMVIEPITGAVLCTLTGMVAPEYLLQTLLDYMESSPLDYCINLPRKNKLPNSDSAVVQDHGTEETHEDAANDVRELGFPALPEEPNDNDTKLVCRVGVRLPDGRRVQRRFRRSDPVQFFWSFCCSELDDAEKKRPFHIAFVSLPGCVGKSLDYSSSSTFDESGLANCMLSLTWD